MERFSKADILQMVEDEDVGFIRLQFTDMLGNLKNIAIPSSRLIDALEGRCSIDLASLEGFSKGKEGNVYLKPDLGTFAILPWRPQQGKVARFLCDICREDGSEYEESPRYILKRTLKKARAMGYEFYLNPECEFFLFHTDDNGRPTTLSHEQAGYLDTSPIDLGENTRRDIILALEDMGYDIASSHHEIAPAQHEIDFTFEDALATADKIMTFKMAVRTIARRYGLYATFMPKPRKEVNGSGMHLHMRLLKDGKNVFSSEGKVLSREGSAFLGGILAHISGMTALFNPLVNSYKRLTPGFEAPSDITWSHSRRNSLLYVRTGREGVDLELRSPDSAANPYLLFALCLEAGLEGIEKGYEAPEETQKNVRSLPENLGDALKEMKEDLLVTETLGETCAYAYWETKRKEWKEYLEQVSEWELNRYLYLI